MPVAFCDLRAAHAAGGEAVEAALLRVARSGRYVLGAEVDAFEHEFSRCCGAAHGVGVASGTDALALILRAAGIGPGDEVVVPAFTAVGTWMAVTAAGATPVGADVDARTGLIDPDAVRAAISSRTAALIAVHLFGALAPMAELRLIAERHGLLLIEDAAHAAGVSEGDARAGSLGDAAGFSFYPTKVMGALGDAGAVLTSDPGLADAIRRLRSYGWSEWQGQAESPGLNSRLDELQAAVLRERLARLPNAHARLREMAGRYRRGLSSCAGLELPQLPGTGEPPWHQFVVRSLARDGLRGAIKARGIETAIHYQPIPPTLRAFPGAGEFARAEGLAARVVSLPFDAWLTDADLDTVAGALRAATGSSQRSVM